MAFYLAGEITQVKESIPWVRCASGNVYTIVHLTQSPFEELSNSDPDTVYLFVYSPNISLCNWSSFQLCQIVLDRSAKLLKHNFPFFCYTAFGSILSTRRCSWGTSFLGRIHPVQSQILAVLPPSVMFFVFGKFVTASFFAVST